LKGAKNMKKTRAQIEEELKKLLLTIIDVEPEQLKPQADFFKDLEVDSIKAIEIVVAIDKHFKISIGEEDIPTITTLEKAVELIYKNTEE
jgi:acyl carrier protein